MEVACGQCLGCRLDRSRVWAMRMVHESSLHSVNSFITLTYRDKVACTEEQLDSGYHIRDDWSLCKDHFQRFMKRLRKTRPGKMKFYHCGEYGNICKHGIDLRKVQCPLCNVGRPHYHAILFNCEFTDLETYETGEVDRYTSPELERIWKYGFVDVGTVTMQSAAYTARYVMKKVTGVNSKEHYTSVDIDGSIIEVEPEYATMSKGIGRDWYERYKDDVFPASETPVPGEGVIKKVPRYYDEILRKEDVEMYDAIKEKRVRSMEDNKEEYTSQRLVDKYKVKKAQTQTLGRKL